MQGKINGFIKKKGWWFWRERYKGSVSHRRELSDGKLKG